MPKSLHEPIIRIASKDRLLSDWEASRQNELIKAKQMGLIPYCTCMMTPVPMELFSREGKVYIRKIKNTQHSDNCEYGNQRKKVVHMPVDTKPVEMHGWLKTYWGIAQLNAWHPGLVGKRSWAVVRKRITEAVTSNSGKTSLDKELFSPESFNLDRADEQKKIALQEIESKLRKYGHFVLFGEVKEVVKSKFDTELKILHAAYLKLWAHEKYLNWLKPEGDHRQFILAKVKKSDKGNFYIDHLDYLITSMNYLPVLDTVETGIIDRLAKNGASFTVDIDNGITSVATKKPLMRFLVLNEESHERINQGNSGNNQKGEIVALLNEDNADEVMNLLLSFSNPAHEECARINDEPLGFS